MSNLSFYEEILSGEETIYNNRHQKHRPFFVQSRSMRRPKPNPMPKGKMEKLHLPNNRQSPLVGTTNFSPFGVNTHTLPVQKQS